MNDKMERRVGLIGTLLFGVTGSVLLMIAAASYSTTVTAGLGVAGLALVVVAIPFMHMWGDP